MKTDEVINEARTWLGIPYQHQGRTQHGIDCAGLVIKVAHSLGLSSFDADGYSRVPSGHRMRRELLALTEEVETNEMRPGDILHFAFSHQPQHVALITRADPLSIIHADSVVGRVVEHILDDEWLDKVRGVYRIPGVEL